MAHISQTRRMVTIVTIAFLGFLSTNAARQAFAGGQEAKPAADQQQPADAQPKAQADQPQQNPNSGPGTTVAPGSEQQPNQLTPPSNNDTKNSDNQSTSNQPNNSAGTNLQFNAPSQSKSGAASSGQPSRGASLGVNITMSDDGRGIIITRVSPNTPAQQIGLRPRDQITSLNGNPVGAVDEFISNIRSMKPGDQVELTINRDGNETVVRGNLEPYAQAIARNGSSNADEDYRSYQNGDQRNRWDDNRLNGRIEPGATVQTSFEDRGPTGNQPSGNVDARLTRIEQQIDRLSQEVAELRTAVVTSRQSSSLRDATSAERPGTGLQPQQQSDRNRVPSSQPTPPRNSNELPSQLTPNLQPGEQNK